MIRFRSSVLDMTSSTTPLALSELLPDLLLDHVRRHLDDPRAVLDGLTSLLPTADTVLAALPAEDRCGSATSALLHAETGFSVVAMVTAPGQRTSIHDHLTWCASVVLTGTECEESFYLEDNRLRLTGVRADSAGSRSLVDSDGIHRVTNVGAEVAFSLHVYAADLGNGRTSVRSTFDHLPVVAENSEERPTGARPPGAGSRE